MDIVFTNTWDVPDDGLMKPKPTSEFLPEWYKKTQTYLDDKKRVIENFGAAQSIKKCIPVFDAMTAGYVITTIADVWVEQRGGEPYYIWKNEKVIEFHPVTQLKNHPLKPPMPHSVVPKWLNPFMITTPKGWSCVLVPPMHNPNGIFTALPAIVDTDEHHAPINFPFTLNDPNFEGLIPAGTPILQVIPFKREKWKMRIGKEEDKAKANKYYMLLTRIWFDFYKNNSRTIKEYK